MQVRVDPTGSCLTSAAMRVHLLVFFSHVMLCCHIHNPVEAVLEAAAELPEML